MMSCYELMYRNANKKPIAPAVGKQLLCPLSYLDEDNKIWGISQSLGQAVVSWTGWCQLAVLLSYKAAAPGTSWLSASRGATFVVMLVTDWQTMKYCPCGVRLLLIRFHGECLTLLSLLWLCNRCLTADVGQVVALRQGCYEFALAQDKETKLILLFKGE